MIVNYFVHNAKGEILRTGSCPSSHLLQQADSASGELVRQGAAEDDTQVFNTTTLLLEDKVIAPPTSNELWSEIKLRRNMLLSYCDWTQMPDVPVATQQLWQPYRQALRDITKQTDPANIIFPTPPV